MTPSKALFTLIAGLVCAKSLVADAVSASPIERPTPSNSPPIAKQLWVRDRVLAKLNESPLTVWDIAKRLAAALKGQAPGQEVDAATRCEFYDRFWVQVLNDCIDRELILADAAERKLVPTATEVRAQMEVLFGPDIVDSLQKLGLTYDEAFESVKREITVPRVFLYHTHLPAQQQVGPKLIRETYERFVASQGAESRWIYRVVSIETPDEGEALKIADELKTALTTCANWQDAERLLQARSEWGSTLHASENYEQRDADLSDVYRGALRDLKSQSWSQPVAFTSKAGNKSYRLFYLVEREQLPCPSLRESAPKLRELLIEQRADEIAKEYLVKLRKRYRYQLDEIEAGIPPNFTPFSTL